MLLVHFFIPASSTRQGSLSSLAVAGLGDSTGHLTGTSVKGGGTDISGSSAVLPTHAAKLSWEDLMIFLFALVFCSKASSGVGFWKIYATDPGNGGGVNVSSNDGRMSDESPSYGLDLTFSFLSERLGCVAEEVHEGPSVLMWTFLSIS